jgi:hypothetical protein
VAVVITVKSAVSSVLQIAAGLRASLALRLAVRVVAVFSSVSFSTLASLAGRLTAFSSLTATAGPVVFGGIPVLAAAGGDL